MTERRRRRLSLRLRTTAGAIVVVAGALTAAGLVEPTRADALARLDQLQVRFAASLVAAAAWVTLAACSSSTAAQTTSTTASTSASQGTMLASPGTTGTPHAVGPSAGCDAATVASAGTTDERITSGGEERSYQLIIPEGYDGTEPLPIVFGLHSLTGDCRLGDRIAAIATIAGVEYSEPCDGPPVPVIAFHGFEDPIVPYTGGGLNSVTIANQNFYAGDLPAGIATPTGADESMSRWAEHNGCHPEPSEERVSPEFRQQTWQNCDAPTVLYVVDDGGHAWTGKPQSAFEASFGHGTTEIDASSMLFEFFFEQEV